MCVCVCIISHPAVPCLSLPPFYPCTCLTFRGWGSCSSCVGTHYIYIPCFQSSSNPLSSSLTVRRVYTYKSLFLSICLSRVPPVFSFFSHALRFTSSASFLFFSPAYCFTSFLFYCLFWGVCLFVYYLIQNQKEIKSFWNTWRRPRGYATAISDGSRMTIEILIAFHLLLQLSTTVCGKSLFLFFFFSCRNLFSPAVAANHARQSWFLWFVIFFHFFKRGRAGGFR